MASTSKDKNLKRKKDREAANGPPQKKQQQKQNNEFGCYFCRISRHVKNNCAKCHAWYAKKATLGG